MKNARFFTYIFHIFIFSCSSISTSEFQSEPVKSSVTKEKPNNAEWKQWQHLDVVEDSLVGVSLNKAYGLISDKKVDTTIIAVLDTRFISGKIMVMLMIFMVGIS